jgi:hypothetical protein
LRFDFGIGELEALVKRHTLGALHARFAAQVVDQPPSDQDCAQQQQQMDSAHSDLDAEPENAPSNDHRNTKPEEQLHRISARPRAVSV